MLPVSTESAVLILAVSQLLVPLLNGLLSRRQQRQEAAVDPVPLLVQSLGAVAQDVRDIQQELRVVGEHGSTLKLLTQRVDLLEDWMGGARPQPHPVANHVTVLLNERTASHLQYAANGVAKDAGPGHP